MGLDYSKLLVGGPKEPPKTVVRHAGRDAGMQQFARRACLAPNSTQASACGRKDTSQPSIHALMHACMLRCLTNELRCPGYSCCHAP